MAEFDHGIKKIAETTGRQLARVAGVECRQWTPLDSTLQATTERLADRVFQARQGRKRFVVYFEFYTTWDRDAPWDMLGKSGLLSQQQKQPTVCIAVVLRRRGFRTRNGQMRLAAAGGPTQQLWFREACLWRIAPEAWWEEEPGLMALYPLCQHGRRPREAIQHAASVIEWKVKATGEQANFLTLLGIFGKLNYPRIDVLGIIGREKMKESKFYQEILQEGEQMGELKALRKDILRVLRARFGADAATEFVPVLDALDDLAHLEPLLDLAATCARLNEFRAALLVGGQAT